VNECADDTRIRQEIAAANVRCEWQMVVDLTTELNQHCKTCPTCNPEASRELLASLFGGRVEVGR
jgi:hypothetical protein